MPELVSILIPCFNAERWIGGTIASALAQRNSNNEIIVVDDGSTDSTFSVLRSFEDRIQWERRANRGAGSARNRLLELARGDWIQYLDADDWLMPDKIPLQAKALEGDAATDVIFGPITVEYHWPAGVERKMQPIPEPHDPWVLLARWWLPQTGAPLWRRQALEHVGGWKEKQPCCQEHELYLRLLMAGKTFRYHASGGAVYRRFIEGTLSTRNVKLVRRERMKIEQRLEDHLREIGELTPERQHAINLARFEMARSAWRQDRDEARKIHAAIKPTRPRFHPDGTSASAAYRKAYSLLGFEAAERIAAARRSLRLYGAR